jgi:biopolymer transport protein ExbD
MSRRVAWSVSIGIVLIVTGWTGRTAIEHWMSTRIVYPVNMPISLARGHIHTGPFRLNLNTEYPVYVEPGTDWIWEQAHPNCNPYQHLQTRWALYRDGKLVDQLDQPTVLPWFSGFTAGSGVYDLDLEVMSDFSCLDPVHPRLEIVAITENYESAAFGARPLLATGIYVGFALLIFGPIVGFVHSRVHSNKIADSISAGQDFQWSRKLPLRSRILGLPSFGLYGGAVFALLAILMMRLTVGFRYIPRGLWVRALTRGVVPQKPDAWTEPLIVRLKDAGLGMEPKLYVNSGMAGWNDLRSALKKELGRRQEWVVYVAADDCLPWANVAAVIDAAHSEGAKVVLFHDPQEQPCELPLTTKKPRI